MERERKEKRTNKEGKGFHSRISRSRRRRERMNREFRLSTLEGEDQDQEGIFRIYLQLSRIDSSIVFP